ncbi:MAG: NAD-dependent DNA ligase LigA, partial [Clostridia bacterium]|nr:NAD-dependent DNA ligase LigA [Clostridia bacterium]
MDYVAQMRPLIDRLNETAHAYYVLGESVISDMQWDQMYDQLLALEKESGIILPDSPTQRVGGEPLKGFAEHTHITRLWSMDKVQSIEALEEWIRRTEKLTGMTELQYYVEYKFDGLTLNLTYQDGQLVQAATRGNGVTGEAILPQAKTVRAVPLTIPYQGTLEVQGECIMRLSTLEKYNQTAKEPLKNARNAAAGALRNLDPAVTASRRLDAFFYQIGTIEDAPYHSQPEMLDFLRENGFPVSDYLGKPHNHDELIACIREIEKVRSSLDFLIDGVVIKVGDFSLREQMGFTEKFPRWAVAYKFEAEESVTTLQEVTWELGRTGKLTPLAHLEPVDFYGVTVRKATLNNWGDIQRKRVAIGAPVWIRRSNDVIPEIMGRVGEPGEGETDIEKPTHCPACGSELVERGAHLFCMNRQSCKPQSVARISHFASRDAMDIEGFSEKTAIQLYDQMDVRDPADLYRLTMEDA